MTPRIELPLVTTTEPMFFARNQSAALFTVASGAIVVTSVPFNLKMLSTFMASLLYFRVDAADADGTILHSIWRARGLPLCQNGAALVGRLFDAQILHSPK